LLASTIY